MERETGFEPATPTLARLCSTTELFPLGEEKDSESDRRCQDDPGGPWKAAGRPGWSVRRRKFVVGSNVRRAPRDLHRVRTASSPEATWPSGKARVCKTLIHRFESGRRLQLTLSTTQVPERRALTS